MTGRYNSKRMKQGDEISHANHIREVERGTEPEMGHNYKPSRNHHLAQLHTYQQVSIT